MNLIIENLISADERLLRIVQTPEEGIRGFFFFPFLKHGYFALTEKKKFVVEVKFTLTGVHKLLQTNVSCYNGSYCVERTTFNISIVCTLK